MRSTLAAACLAFVQIPFAFSITAITASTHDGNVPQNTRDGSLATRWSAAGNPQWIKYEFAGPTTISAVQIAFFKGNERVSIFDLQVSDDNVTFANVLTGARSSGTSLNPQSFPFPSPRTARYIRYLGHGNNLNTWNSLTEVDFTETNRLDVSPSPLSFGAAGGSASLAVRSNVSWTASETSPWITLSAASGANDGSVEVTASANTGAARSAAIAFAGGGLTRSVTVNQAAGASLSVSPASLSFGAAAGEQTFAVNGNVAWTATANQAWLTVSPGSGSGNAPSVRVTAGANAGGQRAGVVTVAGGGLTATVAVSQAAGGGDAFLPLSGGTMSGSIAFTGGAGITGASSISANEIRIGQWTMRTPDYVFEPGYPLRSLRDVQAFIDRHGHLPDVPSAAKMAEGGVDLAEINMVLLRKVEELTLYLLEQQREIERLKAGK